MQLNRRNFIASSFGALGIGMASGCRSLLDSSDTIARVPWQGAIVGAPSEAGHRLWTQDFPVPSAKRRTRVAIVGGGIAALSAAWWLKRHHFEDFILLELDQVPGGNARSGQNAHGTYPWGAHYIPIPNQESVYVLDLFQELGIIIDSDESGGPVYEQLYLCHGPEDRLYLHGRWQEGLLPQIGTSAEDRQQYQAFFSLVNQLRSQRGGDGRSIFAVPLSLSSQDPEFIKLDRISFAEYLQEHSFTSPPLLWYLDYCCQDDFGAKASAVSAWAGLHYFASRRPWNNADTSTKLLTWPEGNGWIVKKLAEKCRQNLVTGALAFRIEATPQHVSISYLDLSNEQTVTVEADYVLYCAPRFTIPWVMPALSHLKETITRYCHYSPWAVANISVSSKFGLQDRARAWDNVIYQGRGLGYVDSSHQELATAPRSRVLTYYSALCEHPPAKERALLASRNYASWCAEVLEDLKGPHPQLSHFIEQLDVWIWAHGMIRPVPNYIWGEQRGAIPTQEGRILFAHSDQSGMSLFEEAQYQGVERAKTLLSLIDSTPNIV